MSSVLRNLRARRRAATVPLLCAALLLAGCAAPQVRDAGHAGDSVYIVLGEHGVPVARVVTTAPACPAISIDGIDMAMQLRAGKATLPLRPTRSAPADSKPADFPVLTCERVLPAQAASVSVDGQPVPLPAAEVRRIVVIGDTGCRIKKSDKAFQACNDALRYPFARIAAAAAAWKPDLVVHVGDYLYRENACPEGNADCAGSPWGYGWDAWNADFFDPARPLLRAAPWVLVRGNHESCNRAGQGWWRLLDPRALLPGRDCIAADHDDIGDYSDPYAVPIDAHGQIIVLDTSNTPATAIPAGDIRAVKYADLYAKFDALARQADHNIGVDHHPVLGFTAVQDKQGKIAVLPGNAGLQSVFATRNPLLLPAAVDVMLSGHVHVWEQISFSSQHPTQIVAGFSGTSEDIVPLPAGIPPGAGPAPGAIVDHFSSWVDGFGYMTMERRGPDRWDVGIWDTAGQQVNHCRIEGRLSYCDKAQVPK
jgi:hypothetical protein